MITENVQNLFSFIDFLHSNKDYFLSKKPFLDEVKLLREEEQKLDLKNNPEDILNSREINSAIDKIIDPVFYEIRELIETNVLKFNISNDFDVKKGININAYSDLAKLENTFESNDIEVIKTALNRYYDFKTSSFKIVSGFFDMTSNYLFDHLDEIFSETLGAFGAKAKLKIEEVKLVLRTEYENYKGSNLELTINNLEIPIKWTISGIDCYFYNKTLFGLFELKVEKDGIKPDDFADFYKDGFVKGLNFLNDEVQITLQDLRDERKRKNTINEIKNILYYREFSPLKNGIIKTVFDTIPLIFTKTSTYNYGYYNGIMHSLEKLFKDAGLTKDDLMNEAESIPAPQQEQPIKFTAKEYALAYIFDLYANGRQIPINRIEGSLSKKEIEQYGKDNIQFIKPDTFYNAVKDLNKNYNVSIIKDLQNISQDWLNAVKSLAKDWKKTKAYLTAKELYRE